MSKQHSPERRLGLPSPQYDWAVFMDLDGTLVEIAAAPDKVEVSPDMVAAVSGLKTALRGAVALVSGRPLAELDQLMAPLKLPAAGLHGLERRGPDGILARDDKQEARLDVARRELTAFAGAHPGVVVEDKRLAIAVHYRAAPQLAKRALHLARSLVDAHDGHLGLVPGKMVVEIKSKHTNKGAVVDDFMSQAPFRGRIPVFIGDDVTDEDGFKAVNRMGGQSIRVGPPPPGVSKSAAQWECESVGELVAWLKRFVTAPDKQNQSS